jgi:uroporphyrinogen-III synthase
MTAVAISRKVAEALRPAGFRQVVVATSPSGDAVLKAIVRLDTEDA